MNFTKIEITKSSPVNYWNFHCLEISPSQAQHPHDSVQTCLTGTTEHKNLFLFFFLLQQLISKAHTSWATFSPLLLPQKKEERNNTVESSLDECSTVTEAQRNSGVRLNKVSTIFGEFQRVGVQIDKKQIATVLIEVIWICCFFFLYQ